MGYVFIFFTVVFTIYGQLIFKWRLLNISFKLSNNVCESLFSLTKLIFDPYMFSGFLAAFIASLFWIAALTKFELSIAYPFMSLTPAFIFIISIIFFGETFTMGKIIGLLLIVLGVIVTIKLK